MIYYSITKCTSREFEELGGIATSNFKKKANYFIAQVDERLVGYLAFTDDFFLGRGPHLFVGALKTEIERQGIGSSLINALEKEAINRKIPLVVHRFTDNGTFYKKMGYDVNYEYNEAHKWLKQKKTK